MIENYTDFITLSTYFTTFGYFFYKFLSEISKQQLQYVYTSDLNQDKAITHELYIKFSKLFENFNLQYKKLLLIVDKLDVETVSLLSLIHHYKNKNNNDFTLYIINTISNENEVSLLRKCEEYNFIHICETDLKSIDYDFLIETFNIDYILLNYNKNSKKLLYYQYLAEGDLQETFNLHKNFDTSKFIKPLVNIDDNDLFDYVNSLGLDFEQRDQQKVFNISEKRLFDIVDILNCYNHHLETNLDPVIDKFKVYTFGFVLDKKYDLTPNTFAYCVNKIFKRNFNEKLQIQNQNDFYNVAVDSEVIKRLNRHWYVYSNNDSVVFYNQNNINLYLDEKYKVLTENENVGTLIDHWENFLNGQITYRNNNISDSTFNQLSEVFLNEFNFPTDPDLGNKFLSFSFHYYFTEEGRISTEISDNSDCSELEHISESETNN
jgi:hypothetical protein